MMYLRVIGEGRDKLGSFGLVNKHHYSTNKMMQQSMQYCSIDS
jgi:hypothetical protein